MNMMNNMLLNMKMILPWGLFAISLIGVIIALTALFRARKILLAKTARIDEVTQNVVDCEDLLMTHLDELHAMLGESQGRESFLKEEKQVLIGKMDELTEELETLRKDNTMANKLKTAQAQLKKQKQEIEKLQVEMEKYYQTGPRLELARRCLLQVQEILEDIETAKNPAYVLEGVKDANEKVKKGLEKLRNS